MSDKPGDLSSVSVSRLERSPSYIIPRFVTNLPSRLVSHANNLLYPDYSNILERLLYHYFINTRPNPPSPTHILLSIPRSLQTLQRHLWTRLKGPATRAATPTTLIYWRQSKRLKRTASKGSSMLPPVPSSARCPRALFLVSFVSHSPNLRSRISVQETSVSKQPISNLRTFSKRNWMSGRNSGNANEKAQAPSRFG